MVNAPRAPKQSLHLTCQNFTDYSANFRIRRHVSAPVIRSFPPQNLSAKRDVSMDWWETDSAHTSTPPATRKAGLSKDSAPYFLTAAQGGQMPIFQTDDDGRLINEYTRGLVLRELMSRSTRARNPATQASKTPSQFTSAAGLRNISNDSGISACAANSPGSAYSSPSGPLPSASLPRHHQTRPIQVKPFPLPAPKPDWSVERWTIDKLFDLIPKQMHSRLQFSPVRFRLTFECT